MKRLLATLLVICALSFGSYAQTTAKPTEKTKTTKSTKKKKPAMATDATVAAPSTGQKMKKDGTADMRYKENKKKKAAGPMKKDGTPDMRYKANKKAS